MIALALETSGTISSIALSRDGELLVEETFPHGLQHAAALVPMIDSACRKHSIKPSEIEHVYLNIGPGSFTGLRVAVTVAKMLVMVHGTKIVTVPSSEVLAHNAPNDAIEVVTCLDAKRGQVYAARFRREGSEWLVLETVHLDRLSEVMKRASRPVHLIGEGIKFHRASIQNEAGIIWVDESLWRCRASVVLKRGAERARQNVFADPMKLSPTYIRLPEAEEKRLIAEGKISAPQ